MLRRWWQRGSDFDHGLLAGLLAVATLIVAVLGCTPAPEGRVDPGPQADWYYDEGPNGEHCLFAGGTDGVWFMGEKSLYGSIPWRAMDCDTVNWPERGGTGG